MSHALLAGIPLLVGLALALPLGWLARRLPRVAPLIVGGSGLLYTIPSLALFILMPLVLGSKILDAINVYVAMTIYTVALLVRSVVDAFGSVPESTALAATAMGYRRLGRALAVGVALAGAGVGRGGGGGWWGCVSWCGVLWWGGGGGGGCATSGSPGGWWLRGARGRSFVPPFWPPGW